jgi:nucleotide-binding universal stress UspA family protein
VTNNAATHEHDAASPAGRTYLVGYDFSGSARSAARLAVEDLIDAGGGTLLLAHLYMVMPLPAALDGATAEGVVALERGVADDASVALERAAQELRNDIETVKLRRGSHAVVEVESLIRQDAAAEGLVVLCTARKAERIYVGTHGRRGLTHLLLGSVAERVVRLADVPVVVGREPKLTGQ